MEIISKSAIESAIWNKIQANEWGGIFENTKYITKAGYEYLLSMGYRFSCDFPNHFKWHDQVSARDQSLSSVLVARRKRADRNEELDFFSENHLNKYWYEKIILRANSFSRKAISKTTLQKNAKKNLKLVSLKNKRFRKIDFAKLRIIQLLEMKSKDVLNEHQILQFNRDLKFLIGLVIGDNFGDITHNVDTTIVRNKYNLLKQLTESDKTTSNISKNTGINRVTVYNYVRIFESRGFLSFSHYLPNYPNKRKIVWSLTPLGKAITFLSLKEWCEISLSKWLQYKNEVNNLNE
jgi:hypothetical protein